MRPTGGKIVAAGRSFDMLRNKATVSNAKSPTDWVTLKDQQAGAGKGAPGTPTTPAGGEKSSAPMSIAERRRRRRDGGS